MKKDWTYKTLGEVCDINYGTRVVQKRDGGSIYPVYGGGGATFRMDTYNREDCLVVARFAMSPRCTRIVKGKFFLNDSGLTLDAHEELYQDYLNWHIISLNDEIYQTAKGAAQKNLDVKAFASLKIAIPPLSIQRSIVSELDLLHSLIEKKQEQLRALDNLAQSLFYQMFGDPITNPMGWQVKKFAELYKLKSGDGLSAKMFENGPYPVYGGNGISGQHCSYNMDGNYIIIGRVGVYCGNVRNVVGKFWLTDNAFQLFYDEDNNNPIFVTKLLTYLNLNQYANQAAQPVISNLALKDILVPLPPLSLQQSFAAKVSAIEAQKQAITQSIKDVESLLAQRMDHYFG